MPIRVRVTLIFAAVMAVLLTGIGLFLYLRFESQLTETVDAGLRSRAGEVSALVQSQGSGLSRPGAVTLIESDEAFAQVLTPGGEIFDSSPQLGETAALTESDLSNAQDSDAAFFERTGVPGIEGTARILAAPVQADGQELFAVVGSSLQDRDENLSNLATLLLVGGPVALLLASLAGYGAIAAALRPVEAMRRQAAEISSSGPSQRLPVPSTGDELARLGVTLNEMLDRLEATLERERRFVDDASHELRTPLALHKTELELALRYGDDPAELRAAIESAAVEVDRLIALAEGLLVVARSEEGGPALERESLGAVDLLDAAAERFRTRAEGSGREVSVDGDRTLRIDVDRLRIEQALTNMVDNALQHGSGEVLLSATPTDGGVRLTVADQGDGFPPEFITRAFERFSRADTARGRGGAGLGLAIVETVAGAHGGRAGADNAANGGARVWIEILSA